MQNSPRFEISTPIGQGPRADVFNASQRGVKRKVAIKALREGERRVKNKRDEFLREASEWSLHHHPALLGILEVDEDRCWIVTNALEGSLARHSGHVTPYTVLQMLRRGLEALKFLHSRSLLHLNVKLSNLLVDEAGEIVLADGRMVAMHDTSRLPSHLGSYRYAPPESMSTALGQIGPAADLYSLGICMMELLLGGRFEQYVEGVGPDAPDPESSWMNWGASREKHLPPARTLSPSLPVELAEVLDTLVLKEVARRYGNAGDALAAIAHLQLEPDQNGATLYDRDTLQSQQTEAKSPPPATAMDSVELLEPIVVPGTRESGVAGLMVISGEQSGTFVKAENNSISAGARPDYEVQLQNMHESVEHCSVTVQRGLQQGWQVELTGFNQFILNHELQPSGTPIRSGDVFAFSVWGPYLQFLYEPPVRDATQWNEIADDLNIRSNLPAQPGRAPSQPVATGAGVATNTSPSTATQPAGPSAPSGPSAPTAPSGPSPPAAPTGPVAPAGPNGPAGPTSAAPQPAAPAGNVPQPQDGNASRISILNYKSWDKKTLNWVVAVVSIIVAIIAFILVPTRKPAESKPKQPPAPLKANPVPAGTPPAVSDSGAPPASPPGTPPATPAAPPTGADAPTE